MPHGFSQMAWDRAREEATAVLKEKAEGRHDHTIAYSDLASRIRAISIDAHDPRFGHLLGEISEEQDDAGFGLLSVLVVHKSGDLKPGPGFFDLASARGRDVSDIERCWNDEIREVVALHGGRIR